MEGGEKDNSQKKSALFNFLGIFLCPKNWSLDYKRGKVVAVFHQFKDNNPSEHKHQNINMKIIQTALLGALMVALEIGVARAGVRCSVGSFLSVFSTRLGDSACSAGCVALGQTSGICSDDGTCK